MKKLLLAAFVLIGGGILTSCSDDGYSDVDGQAPTLALASDHLKTAAGHSFTITGTLTDNDGIQYVKIVCSALYLDKTIDIVDIYGEPLTTYDLNYTFNIQSDEIGDQFTVTVTVIDIGGRETSQTVTVTMDGDFENPVFTVSPSASVTVLIKEETKYTLRFAVSDDQALDYLTIEMPGVIDLTTLQLNSAKTYSYEEKLILPSVEGEYTLTVVVVDKEGNSTTATSVITTSELQDFEKMYLADVATAEELNSDVFGVPMRIEHTGEYEYQADYYNEAAGTEIYFLPQKTDFSPICFGLDPDDRTKLTDDPETAQPIVLDQANVYYKITFNTMESWYEISTYSIDEAVDPVPHEYGSISLDTWEDGGSWLQEFYFGYCTSNPTSVERFTQDSTNPHYYYLDTTLSFTAGDQMNFIIHNWHSDGWWNYCTWRVDDSEEPEIFGYYGNHTNSDWTEANWVGDNWAKPTVNATGNYKLYFDAHLGRGKLVRVN